jgi:DNA-binding CsgD family transcriptional regulator
MASEDAPLQMDDVAAVIRLLGDLASFNGTLPDKRKALADGLCNLLNAQGWMWNHVRWEPGLAPVPFGMLDGGWENEKQRALVFAAVINPPTDDAMLKQVGPFHLTRTRRQLLGDEAWFASQYHATVRAPSGLEDFLISIHPAGPPHIYSGLGLHRSISQGYFSDRDRCIIHLILSQIRWIHQVDESPEGATEAASLSPRLRQILLLLLAGHSRKQIARGLDLSEHTVDDYMKAMHRHFRVSSRGELMARFISGGPTPQIG